MGNHRTLKRVELGWLGPLSRAVGRGGLWARQTETGAGSELVEGRAASPGSARIEVGSVVVGEEWFALEWWVYRQQVEGGENFELSKREARGEEGEG